MSTDYRIADLNQIAVVLRSFRRARKLTQAQLAERLGVVQQSYARMESQPAATSVSNLMKILGVLGVDLVLRDREPMASTEPTAKSQIKKTSVPSSSQRTQKSPAEIKRNLRTPPSPTRWRLKVTSDTTKSKGIAAQTRTGKILPLPSKKGW